MNDSFGKISSPAPPATSRGFGANGQTAQILVLPADLENNTRALRVEGQITNLRPDNRATIQTPAGDIEVQLRSNTSRLPQVGQQVEIDIPARATRNTASPDQNTIRQSSTTTQAVIRTAPTAPAIPDSAIIRPTYTGPLQANVQAQGVVPERNTSALPPPPTQGAQGNQGTQATQQPTSQTLPQPATPSAQQVVTQQQAQLPPLSTLLNQTNLTPAVKDNIATTVLPAAPNTLGNIAGNVDLTNNTVRLLPVTPPQAQAIATQFIQSLPPPQFANLSQNVFAAPTVIAPAVGAQSSSLLTPTPSLSPVVTTPPIQTPQLLNNTSPLIQNTLQPIQNITLSPPTPTAQTTVATPNQNVISNFSIPNSPNNIATQITTTVSPPTVSTAASNLGQIIGQVDIQVVRVTPPPTLITAPSLQTAAITTPTSAPISTPATTNFTPPIISANTATTLTAQVTGFTPQSLPLVTTQLSGARLPQSFILQHGNTNLQLGSQIQFTPNANNAATSLPSLTPRAPALNPLLQGFQWPVLDELMTSLQQLSPQAAASLGRSLPNAGNPSQIAPAAMMFAAALRSGDVASWLGDRKMDLLQQAGKNDVISRLSQGGGASPRLAAAETAPTGEWRAVPLPMFWEGEIHKITLYTRNEDRETQQKDQNHGATRFVFDLSLSRMGDIQLDGLLRNDRLDLVLRAQNVFSEPMQQTMRQAYSAALDSTALTGELSFQGSTKNWVHVIENKEQLGVHV